MAEPGFHKGVCDPTACTLQFTRIPPLKSSGRSAIGDEEITGEKTEAQKDIWLFGEEI